MGELVPFPGSQQPSGECTWEDLPDDMRDLWVTAVRVDQAYALAFGVSVETGTPVFLRIAGIKDSQGLLVSDELKRGYLTHSLYQHQFLLEAAAPFLDDPEQERAITDADRKRLKAMIPKPGEPLQENEIPFSPDPVYRDFARNTAAIRRDFIKEIDEASAQLRRDVEAMLERKLELSPKE